MVEAIGVGLVTRRDVVIHTVGCCPTNVTRRRSRWHGGGAGSAEHAWGAVVGDLADCGGDPSGQTKQKFPVLGSSRAHRPAGPPAPSARGTVGEFRLARSNGSFPIW